MANQLPWAERVTMLSIHPDAASRDDVAKMAAEVMAMRHELTRLLGVLGDEDVEIVERLLSEDSIAA